MKNKIPKIKTSDLKLTGKKIILRPLKISDAQDIYSNIQDKRIVENMRAVSWPYKLKNAQKFIGKVQKAGRTGEHFAFGIELKSKKGVIGYIGLKEVDSEHRSAGISYWLGANYWNREIMTEAGKLILNFAFRKLKLHRVWANVFRANPASKKILEKLGFKKEGVHRKTVWRFGCWKDEVHYGLLVEEFLKK